MFNPYDVNRIILQKLIFIGFGVILIWFGLYHTSVGQMYITGGVFGILFGIFVIRIPE